MVVLPAERNILAGHPVKSPRHIPSLIRIARVLGEIRRARSSRRAIDRRQQNQIPPGIINLLASQCQAILVVVGPQAALENGCQKKSIRTRRAVARAIEAGGLVSSHLAHRWYGCV